MAPKALVLQRSLMAAVKSCLSLSATGLAKDTMLVSWHLAHFWVRTALQDPIDLFEPRCGTAEFWPCGDPGFLGDATAGIVFSLDEAHVMGELVLVRC